MTARDVIGAEPQPEYGYGPQGFDRPTIVGFDLLHEAMGWARSYLTTVKEWGDDEPACTVPLFKRTRPAAGTKGGPWRRCGQVVGRRDEAGNVTTSVGLGVMPRAVV